jgi:GT2 family glycosyltransferase
MEEITVIIPTHNRIELLKRVLIALNEQTYDMNCVEIIVIDDYSLINPKKEIFKLKVKYKLKFFRMKKNVGQGMVRNKALEFTKNKYVLFLGDDMIPKRNLIEEHMKLHRKYKGIAVLGRVFWADEVRNEFMNYIEGIQFHYKNIRDKKNARLHFYTSNISLERSWFNNQKYNPLFKNYGLEDIELGYRLENLGLKIFYNPAAIVYHVHRYTFEEFCERMKNVGKSAVIFINLHPELKRKYITPFNNLFKGGSFIFSNKMFKLINKKVYWYSNFVYNYLNGIDEGLKNVERE